MSSPKVYQWKGTEEHFKKSHIVFRQKSGQLTVIINSLRSHLPLTLKSILHEPRSKDGINILSVGSGDGDMDIEILKIVNEEIQGRRPSDAVKVFNRAIEPNAHALNHYKNTITTSLPKELANASIVFDIDRPQTFEENMANVKETVEFDIIHFIHSIYHITDVEKALKYCYEKGLGNYGAIVLILGNKDDFMELLKQRIWGTGQLDYKIVEIARNNDWHHELCPQEYSIDLTEIFDKDSIKGNLLLDFFTHSQNFRFNADPDKVKETLNFIKDNSVFENGKCLAKMYSDVHIIFK